jgi:V/A-type H+-transporting ATPase subunit I
MSLRPAPARWFELLAAREDVASALELLARTGAVELDIKTDETSSISLYDMRVLVEQFALLERRYHAYWPRRDLLTGVFPGGPYRILTAALGWLERWEQQASPLIEELEAVIGTQRDLNLFADLLRAACEDNFNYAQLVAIGPALAGRVFVLPAGSTIDAVTDSLLLNHYNTPVQDFVLAIGTPERLEALSAALAGAKARVVPIPDFIHGTAQTALRQVEQRLANLDTLAERLRQKIEMLTQAYQLRAALGEIERLDWFLKHVERLPVSRNFAWITGWTSDPQGHRLEQALAGGAVRALVHFPAPPAAFQPPMVLRNPVWARPFERFVNLLGTPAAAEADPSSLLAVLVPLMFGYMFGDVGQGLVLLAAALLLRRRWPVLNILAMCGSVSVAFGVVFGSVFGREDIIPALWVHPIEQPLPVLQAPLAFGVLVLLLGLLLKALQLVWQGAAKQWWRLEAPQLVLYISVLTMLVSSRAGPVAGGALLWYLLGSRLQQRDDATFAMTAALGNLVENLVQLLINTLSFVRVGAFALAHAGLALAFTTLADMPESRVLAVAILVLGNLVVIVLEGLVVTVQTTRLVLFEFFIRFVHAGGRVFRPLAAPAPGIGLGSKT